MAIDLEDLLEATKVAVNGVGGEIVTASKPAWLLAIANGFWQAKNAGFFSAWRLDPNNDNAITPVPPNTEDMPGELQQLVIMATAIDQIELAVLGMDVEFTAKSGEEEISTKRSASSIAEIIKARRAQLEQLRVSLVENPQYSTYVGVVDLLGLRLGRAQSSAQVWVNG